MNMENESSKSDVQCVQSVQSIGTECGPSGADVSCAKPDINIASSQLVSDVSVLSCAKPTGNGSAASMVVSKVKKKVWGVKKNGLYDWKMVVVDQRTSTNIHTQNIHTQPNSTSKLISIPQQNIYFKNWLVAPNRKVGGDGLKSYILEVNTSANSAKIGEKKQF